MTLPKYVNDYYTTIASSACPRCNAPIGAPCVYPYPRGNTRNEQFLARTGWPSNIIHSERRRTVHQDHNSLSGRLTAIHTIHQWELREQQQLRVWLAEHADLLWSVAA